MFSVYPITIMDCRCWLQKSITKSFFSSLFIFCFLEVSKQAGEKKMRKKSMQHFVISQCKHCATVYRAVSFLICTKSTEKDAAGICKCHCSNGILKTETGSWQLPEEEKSTALFNKIKATHINHLSSVSCSF